MSFMIFVRCGVKRERRPTGRHVLVAHATLAPCPAPICAGSSRWQVTSDERMGPSARDYYFGSRLVPRNIVASQNHRPLGGGKFAHGPLSADLVFECSCDGDDHEVGLDAATAAWALDEAAKAGRQAIWLPVWLPLTVSA